jgi:hypothetical protein
MSAHLVSSAAEEEISDDSDKSRVFPGSVALIPAVDESPQQTIHIEHSENESNVASTDVPPPPPDAEDPEQLQTDVSPQEVVQSQIHELPEVLETVEQGPIPDGDLTIPSKPPDSEV